MKIRTPRAHVWSTSIDAMSSVRHSTGFADSTTRSARLPASRLPHSRVRATRPCGVDGVGLQRGVGGHGLLAIEDVAAPALAGDGGGDAEQWRVGAARKVR